LQGVLHYHATYVQPEWSKEKERVARIGRHVFYR
jgi:spore germination cell wall hydrolase CwlJ-like protein